MWLKEEKKGRFGEGKGVVREAAQVFFFGTGGRNQGKKGTIVPSQRSDPVERKVKRKEG